MLDAFIIDRIRRERERERDRQGGRIPLRIERHPPPPPEAPRHDVPPGDNDGKRGSVVIDFRL